MSKYGVRDVCEVVLLDLTNNEKPVLYLDTLLMSTLDNNKSRIYASGGKGKKTLDRGDLDKE